MKLQSIIYISILGLLLFVLSCSEEKIEKTKVVRPVRYHQILLTGTEQNRTFSGTSKAGTEARLSFKVSGTLTQIRYKVGDHLKKGVLIAFVDDTDARLNYEKSLVALEKSRIQKETAQSSLTRVKGLYENNNVSLQDYETAKSNYAAARAAYNADKKNVVLQKRSLDYFKLYAPISGIVAAVNAEKNENIKPGQVIVVMNTGDDIEIIVGVPESFILKIKAGGNVTVKFASSPGKIFDGVISEVAYNISSTASTYPATIVLSSPTKDIRPGMSADVSFIPGDKTNKIPDKIITPVAAVGKDTKGNFVFVLNKDSNSTYRVEKRAITIGELLPEGFEVISGINENELIATAGLNSLMDDMKVRLLEK
jgi:membrane fusion protein, multidrug efflux system